LGFLGLAAWVWVHGVVVVDGLGLSISAWVCQSLPKLADLDLGWLCSMISVSATIEVYHQY
jgi:hypothetical protein